MSENFKALVLNQDGENFTREIKSVDKSFLKHGDVTVKVHYSGLNYKDALILKNGARLVKEFPHIPGIDFSGVVEESKHDKFKKGDEIILTGWRVGEIYFGGYSHKLGCNVTAVTGKESNKDYLKSIGAKNIINTRELTKDARPLDKGLWDGAVDTVGGKVLENILATTKDSGIVAACGNAADIKLNTTVMPFIIRGVKLWGINSVNASIQRRQFLWNEASKLIDFELLGKSIKEISLEELIDVYPKMLKGETSGRYIINLEK